MNLKDAREIAMMYNYIEHCENEIRKLENYISTGWHIYVEKGDLRHEFGYNNLKVFNFALDAYKSNIEKYKKKIEEFTEGEL